MDIGILLAAGAVRALVTETVLIAAANTVLMYFAVFKFMQTLQQSSYEGRGFLKWLKRRDNIYMMRLVIVSILSVLAYLIFNIAIMIFTDSEWVTFIGFIFYAVFFSVYISYDRRMKSRLPLVRTARINRLTVTYVILTFFISWVFLMLLNLFLIGFPTTYLLVRVRYGLLCLSPLALPAILLAAFYLNEPFERYNKSRYVQKCTAALNGREDLIKIGITGSYGKTTVKVILDTILSERFCVLSSPHSFNTPMGICRTVKKLSASHEVFIAEMGARNVGDIRELAEIVRPKYAVITGITGQHLETFGTLSEVKKTKYELIESLEKDGVAVFSSDSKNTLELYEACPVKKILAGLNAIGEVWAEDVSVSEKGTRFTLCVGEDRAECSTVLLGRHNVSNICLAAALAAELGMSAGEIAAGINKIKPIPHRLQIIPAQNGAVVIDDSFNANVEGTIAALEVLDRFEGRKIVVTPGLVELGKTEDYENYELGKRLSGHADTVILVGKRRVDRIKDGLISRDFPEDKILVVKDLADAKEELAKTVHPGDVVFFENDLPDKYN